MFYVECYEHHVFKNDVLSDCVVSENRKREHSTVRNIDYVATSATFGRLMPVFVNGFVNRSSDYKLKADNRNKTFPF